MLKVEKIDIPAIHEDDLEKILQKHGLLEQLSSGTLKCEICKSAVTLENVYGFIFKNQGIQLFCDSSDCIETINMQQHG